MPLDRLVLIIVVVIAAAGLTVFLGAFVAANLQFGTGIGWFVVLPIALVLYIIARVILDRVNSSEDDKYDRIEK